MAELRREKQEALSAIQSKDKDLGQAQRDLSQAQVWLGEGQHEDPKASFFLAPGGDSGDGSFFSH